MRSGKNPGYFLTYGVVWFVDFSSGIDNEIGANITQNITQALIILVGLRLTALYTDFLN